MNKRGCKTMGKHVKQKVDNKNNRRKWFEYLFDLYDVDIKSIADEMNIKRDSLYKKLSGVNAFLERDIDIILNALNDSHNEKITYEYVFKGGCKHEV